MLPFPGGANGSLTGAVGSCGSSLLAITGPVLFCFGTTKATVTSPRQAATMTPAMTTSLDMRCPSFFGSHRSSGQVSLAKDQRGDLSNRAQVLATPGRKTTTPGVPSTSCSAAAKATTGPPCCACCPSWMPTDRPRWQRTRPCWNPPRPRPYGSTAGPRRRCPWATSRTTRPSPPTCRRACHWCGASPAAARSGTNTR